MNRFATVRSGFRRGLASVVMIAGLALTTVAWADEDGPERAEPVRGRALMDRWAEASPEERRLMRGQLRARWAEASPREKRRFARRLRRLERALPEFNSVERLILLRVAAEMSRADREALRARIAGIDELEAEDRKTLLAELRGLIEGYDGEVRRLERNSRRWQEMSEDERDAYRSQMKRWRALSEDEREALLQELERRRGDDDDNEGSE